MVVPIDLYKFGNHWSLTKLVPRLTFWTSINYEKIKKSYFKFSFNFVVFR